MQTITEKIENYTIECSRAVQEELCEKLKAGNKDAWFIQLKYGRSSLVSCAKGFYGNFSCPVLNHSRMNSDNIMVYSIIFLNGNATVLLCADVIEWIADRKLNTWMKIRTKICLCLKQDATHMHRDHSQEQLTDMP